MAPPPPAPPPGPTTGQHVAQKTSSSIYTNSCVSTGGYGRPCHGDYTSSSVHSSYITCHICYFSISTQLCTNSQRDVRLLTAGTQLNLSAPSRSAEGGRSGLPRALGGAGHSDSGPGGPVTHPHHPLDLALVSGLFLLLAPQVAHTVAGWPLSYTRPCELLLVFFFFF